MPSIPDDIDRRADLCTRLARRELGYEVSDEAIEERALELMRVPEFELREQEVMTRPRPAVVHPDDRERLNRRLEVLRAEQERPQDRIEPVYAGPEVLRQAVFDRIFQVDPDLADAVHMGRVTETEALRQLAEQDRARHRDAAYDLLTFGGVPAPISANTRPARPRFPPDPHPTFKRTVNRHVPGTFKPGPSRYELIAGDWLGLDD